jgi:hypothetical protein
MVEPAPSSPTPPRPPGTEQLLALARLVGATCDHEISCEVLLDRVAAYLETVDCGDARLPAALEEVRQHLAVCPECLEEFEALLKARCGGE